jgi:hypothetical protein
MDEKKVPDSKESGSGIIRVAFCSMFAVLCAWVIASSKVVRRPWTGIWYTSRLLYKPRAWLSDLGVSVDLSVCLCVCLFVPTEVQSRLSVSARRNQWRKFFRIE